MKGSYPLKNAHTLSIEEAVLSFSTNVKEGLTQAEADNRNQEFGPNSYQTKKQKSLWLVFFRQFKSPIVYLLVGGASVSLYFNDVMEAVAIAVVIVINALIGFFMELQARKSMDALKELDVQLSRVTRDGKTQEISSQKLTPGDVLLLDAGDVIAADGCLISNNDLHCDEASLTGESFPSEKAILTLEKDTPLADQHNMVFKGTSVINGNGKAIVTGIGKETQLGSITSLVETAEETATPLDKKLAALSKKLIWLTLLLTIFFAISGVLEGKEWVTIIKTSIALAVAAFPEGLPIVSTVALAYGMLLMAKRNAIVKKLSSVETLGSTNIILTDKTGTLTENKIHVDTLLFPEETVKVSIEKTALKFLDKPVEKSGENFELLKQVGTLCNNASLKPTEENKKALGDPMEIALLNFTNAAGTPVAEWKTAYKRIAELPFSSETKMMCMSHLHSDKLFIAVKGSVEQLLEKCSHIQSGKAIISLNEEAKKKVLANAETIAAQGLRMLAFAYKEGKEFLKDDYLKDLTYVGTIGFLDPPRLDIKGAIATCKKAGIKIVMITGDHPLTALNIAKKIGVVNEEEQQVIIGKDMPEMETLNDEWRTRILTTSVFARTTPKQKLEIAGVYQKAGNIVAMTGDGVNDAPALKKADIGIAMGIRGTQVAKEAASIVLKDDSFISISEAVAHGREIFQNIQKFVIYLVSCNLSEIFVITAIGFLAPAAILFPLQILFLNMVTDVFPALALGLGKGDNTVMLRPPRDARKEILTTKNWITISLYSLAMTAAVLLAIIYCRSAFSTDSHVLNNVAFITLVFAQLLHVFNMASYRSKMLVNEVTRNGFVWAALSICIGIVVLIYAIPQLRVVLGLVVLPISVWVMAIGASSLPLILFQGYKFFGRLNNHDFKK